MNATDEKTTGPGRFRAGLLQDSAFAAAAVLALCLLAAYWNSFGGAFVLDDLYSIAGNETIRRLWPPVATLPDNMRGQTLDGRPLLHYTFALNYAFGGLNPFGYHLVNLLIHFAAAFTLWHLVRHTLRLAAPGPQAAKGAHLTALAAALLWALHPLQTESVTYVVQRAESLSSLFYLLTLYFGARAASGGGGEAKWSALAAASCLSGVLVKEIVATAPIAVLLYDRFYCAGSFREALKRRRGLYAGLAASWVALGALIVNSGSRNGSVGFALGVTPLAYLATQLWAVAHYLRLAFYPSPLILDYGTALVTDPVAVISGAAVVLPLLGLALFAAWKEHPLAFPALLFFLALAPTSSIVPVSPPIHEHRMYLALAPLILVLVLGARAAVSRLGWDEGTRRKALAALAIVCALALGGATRERNFDYGSEFALWKDTVEKRPGNARARHALALELLGRRRIGEAAEQFVRARELAPWDPEIAFNFAALKSATGDNQGAARLYEEALALNPDYSDAHANYAMILAALGNLGEARVHAAAAVRLGPGRDVLAPGIALMILGRTDEAATAFERAIGLRPDYAEAYNNLGLLYLNSGRPDRAVGPLARAIELKPDNVQAQYNLARALGALGRHREAIPHFQTVLRFHPGHPAVLEELRRAQELAR